MSLLGRIALGVVLVGAVEAQPIPEQPGFSVASFKKAVFRGSPEILNERGNSVTCICRLNILLRRAFDVEASRLAGPTWLREEFYELNATMPEGSTRDQIPAMLRLLLSDRLHLAVHREPGDAPEIFSEIRKLGLQLTPAKLPIGYIILDRIDRDPAEN